jgi:hypothetical protein
VRGPASSRSTLEPRPETFPLTHNSIPDREGLVAAQRWDGIARTFGVVVAEEDIGTMVIGLIPILLCPNFIACHLCLCQTFDFRRVQPFFILSMLKSDSTIMVMKSADAGPGIDDG